jgi:hypothetical protein
MDLVNGACLQRNTKGPEHFYVSDRFSFKTAAYMYIKIMHSTSSGIL